MSRVMPAMNTLRFVKKRSEPGRRSADLQGCKAPARKILGLTGLDNDEGLLANHSPC